MVGVKGLRLNPPWPAMFGPSSARLSHNPKLRIKISGCMRSMTGAQEFCAIRSCLSTAARHGISALDALTSAFQGRPWIPETG